MFRYVFGLLLLSFSYSSFGVPLPLSVSPASLSLLNLLTALAGNCENRFLVDQIKAKLEYCSDLSPPRGPKQLDCLIFYDINKQLCTAVGGASLAITEDYSAKINAVQDVNLLCETSNQWIFTNLTNFPHYKGTVEKIFKHPVTCGKVCSVDDVDSIDANFYCKYFKWGTDMLKVQVSVPSLPQENAVRSSETVNESKQASNDLVDVKIKNTSTNTPTQTSAIKNVTAKVAESEDKKVDEVKLEASSENNAEMKPQSVDTAVDKSEVKVQEPVQEENQAPSDQVDKPAEITNPEENNEGPKDSDVTLTKPESDANKAEIDKLNKELDKEPVIENPGQSKDKAAGDSADYQDGDEGKEGLGDIQGDDDGDDDDSMIGDINKVKLEDPKEEPSETQNLKNIVSGITGESSLYPSFGQDEYSDNDDDHFFSFFLTAVIMVVLIYILYHNKNKVGKVFFGLILEGRQSGRRRNSRGHAYRRLDTLEQAMSTNSAAPPSKIIY